MKPYPKFKKKKSSNTLRAKVLNKKADARQCLKYIRESNYSNDQAFDIACREIERQIWGDKWKDKSTTYSARGAWVTIFMEHYINKTNEPPENAFERAKKVMDVCLSSKTTPLKAALIEAGKYKRAFRGCQDAMFLGDYSEAERVRKEFYNGY